MRLKIFSIASILIIIIEFILCFYGPMAMVQKPSLIMIPAISYQTEEDDLNQLANYIERQFASFNSFDMISAYRIEEYLETKNLTLNDVLGTTKRYYFNDWKEVAAALNADRFLIVTVMPSSNGISLSFALRETATGDKLKNSSYNVASLEDFYKGTDYTGNPIDLKEDINIETKGITFFDWIFFLILATQTIIALMAFFNREPGNIPEIVIVFTFLQFLFAYIYALNAGMDYVQRFIAYHGQITLAGSTAEEQLYASLRFLPIVLINLWYYLWRRLGKTSPHNIFKTFQPAREGAKAIKPDIKSLIQPWAMFWTFLSALLYGWAFPSAVNLDGFFFLGWICLVPFLLVIIYSRYHWGLFYGISFGAMQALVINYWQGTFDYVSLNLVIIAFIIQYLIFMLPFVWLVKKAGKWGFLMVPVLWVSYDFIRGNGILGYPWGMLGTSQYPLIPLIQMAGLTGVWGITFLVTLGNSATAWLLAAGENQWQWLTNFKAFKQKSMDFIRTWFPGVIFAALLIISLTGGTLYLCLAGFWNDPSNKEKVEIVLVQQNTDPRKHDYEESFENCTTLTLQSIQEAGQKPDLIVWSEGAFKPDIRSWSKTTMEYGNGKLVKRFLDFQQTLETWLLTGNQDHRIVQEKTEEQEEIKELFNSTVLFDCQGNRRQTFHKIHLVPFTEYFPWKEEMPDFYKLMQKFDISDWTVGDEHLIFKHDKFRFITPICFEDVFSDDIRRFIINGVDIIVNVSNDYWSLTPVEAKQHGITALFRTVENSRPLVRATASGYTVYIDRFGRIMPGAVPFYEMGYVIANVPLPERSFTIYTMLGDWFPILCLITGILYGLCVIGRVFYIKIKTSITKE
jgi:apolipoprotein N-acyltransferase